MQWVSNMYLIYLVDEHRDRLVALCLMLVGWVGGMIMGWSSLAALDSTSSSLLGVVGLGLSLSTRMCPAVLLTLLRLTGVGARGGEGIRLGSSSSIAIVSSLPISIVGAEGTSLDALPFSFWVGGDFGYGVATGGVGEELAELDPRGLSWGGLGVRRSVFNSSSWALVVSAMVVKATNLAAAIVLGPPVGCFAVAASSYPIRLGNFSGVIPSMPFLWRSSGLSNTPFF
ncbi:hypothetical protein V6N13_020031 [Hibiscus sabdariffa]